MLSVTASKGRAHDKEKERSELCLRLKLASNIKKMLVILITGPCSGLNI